MAASEELCQARSASAEGAAVAAALQRLGVSAAADGRLRAGEALLRCALAVSECLAPGSASPAAILTDLGLVAERRGDLEAAARLYQRALGILQTVTPSGSETARSLYRLGKIDYSAGDLEAAATHLTQALAILEQVSPRSRTLVDCLRLLGWVARDRGDRAAAEALHERALTLARQIVPDSFKLADTLDTLAVTVRLRGDLARAESLHRQALAIRERLDPGGADHAESLNSLAIVARLRDDLDTAERLQRQALAIRQRIDPEGPDLASSLNNLGLIAQDQGDLAAAEEHLRRALELNQRLAPGTLKMSANLTNLGLVAEGRGELEEAATLYQQALDIARRIAPASLEVSESLHNLARVRGRQGELAEAEKLIREALVIGQQRAPESLWVANSLHGLGLILRLRGELEEAMSTLRAGVQTLEAQQDRLGGSDEARAAFRAQSMDLYRDAIDLAAEVGSTEEAVHLLERSRARILLAILAERQLSLGGDVPEALEHQRRETAAAYDQAQARLARMPPAAAPDQIASLQARLDELRQRQAELRQELRQASGRMAALRYPQPLDLAGIRRVLPRGTALLELSVGRERTRVFVVDASGELAVTTLEMGTSELRARVVRLRRLIAQGGSGNSRQTELSELAAELYRALIGPHAGAVAAAERVLVVADGPLHLLPFAALVSDAHPGASSRRPGPAYLVESAPLHHALSMTVYAELMQPAEAPAEPRPGPILVAFADPLYAAPSADASLPPLEPLPATRDEVQSIAALFGDRAVIFLGAAATEERVKGLGRSPRILHFAVHGLIDERFPLDSALALALPEGIAEEGDNGLLQAWEIFEQLRIDADLVVLSACETALGKEVAGEGMVGLTRAFQYAGARSVLASLWRVGDESTAELMARFYRHLRAGAAIDQSLRLAQLELLRGPFEVGPEGARATLDATHPFHWAGFVLLGDPGPIARGATE